MNQDNNNFGSDDLFKTMEVPAAKGRDDSSGGIYDPWKLSSDDADDEVIKYIAERLSGSDKMPREIEFVPPQPEETVQPSEAEEPASPADEEPSSNPSEKEESNDLISADLDATQVINITPPASVTPQISEEIPSPKRDGRLWIPVLLSSIFLIVVCFVTLTSAILPVLKEYGFARGMTQIMSPVINANEPPAFTNVLLVGVDEDGYRTDTMMVATYDNELDKVSVMQLPRDTYVANNGRTDKKINSAYIFGIEQLQDEIEIAYGIETHKYALVNLDGFRKLIDAIGGVEMNVPINMIYDDPTQNFHIYLLKGMQTLNGDKAEQFVRFRKNNDGSGYPMGDLQRMQAQKEFIMATIKKAISIDGLSNINELINIAQNHVETDLTFDEISAYCTSVLTAEEGAIEFITAPGEAQTTAIGSYFFVDYDAAREVAQTHFYATAETMSRMKRVVIQPVVPDPEPEPENESPPETQNTPTPSGNTSSASRDDDDVPPDDEQTGSSGAISR